MELLKRFVKLLCRYPEILGEKVLQAESKTMPAISKEFEELLTRATKYVYELQELEVQEWPEFTLDILRADRIKCIGYSNRSRLYSVLLKDGKVRYVSYDSVIIK
jgi:hypothetical protein